MKKKLFLQCQEILHHKTSSSILQDLRDQEGHIHITLLGFQNEITGQQRGAAHKIRKACIQEQNGAEFVLHKGEKQLEEVIQNFMDL